MWGFLAVAPAWFGGVAAAEAQEGGVCEAPAAVPGAGVAGAEPEEGTRVYGHLASAYDLLGEGEPRAAAEELRAALALDPCRPEVQAQLGYVLTGLGDHRAALDHIEAARDLGHADPRLTLQAAYLHERTGNAIESRRRFVQAMDEGDPEVARQAEDELIVRNAAPGLWITDAYTAPLYQSRFDNVVVPVLIRSGPNLTAPRLVQPYGFLRANRDTRSDSEQAEIFAENAVIAGAGIRFRPFGGTMAAYAEAGPTYDLLRSPDRDGGSSFRGSVQAGIYDFRVYGVPRDLHGPGESGLFAELYYDASYYSRFENNGIGYLQFRPGMRQTGRARGALDFYTPILAVVDTRGLYFNNLIEAGLGARWSPPGLGGLTVSAEYLRGRYLRSPESVGGPAVDPLPVTFGGEPYGDLRISVTAPFFLTEGRGSP